MTSEIPYLGYKSHGAVFNLGHFLADRAHEILEELWTGHILAKTQIKDTDWEPAYSEFEDGYRRVLRDAQSLRAHLFSSKEARLMAETVYRDSRNQFTRAGISTLARIGTLKILGLETSLLVVNALQGLAIDPQFLYDVGQQFSEPGVDLDRIIFDEPAKRERDIHLLTEASRRAQHR